MPLENNGPAASGALGLGAQPQPVDLFEGLGGGQRALAALGMGLMAFGKQDPFTPILWRSQMNQQNKQQHQAMLEKQREFDAEVGRRQEDQRLNLLKMMPDWLRAMDEVSPDTREKMKQAFGTLAEKLDKDFGRQVFDLAMKDPTMLDTVVNVKLEPNALLSQDEIDVLKNSSHKKQMEFLLSERGLKYAHERNEQLRLKQLNSEKIPRWMSEATVKMGGKTPTTLEEFEQALKGKIDPDDLERLRKNKGILEAWGILAPEQREETGKLLLQEEQIKKTKAETSKITAEAGDKKVETGSKLFFDHAGKVLATYGVGDAITMGADGKPQVNIASLLNKGKDVDAIAKAFREIADNEKLNLGNATTKKLASGYAEMLEKVAGTVKTPAPASTPAPAAGLTPEVKQQKFSIPKGGVQ